MKFIGQYIQSFIARFRNDVFLEDVSSGTIASGGNLGLDSNNKIVKATISSTTDLTSDVTGTLPVGNGGTGAATLASNSLLTGNGTSAIQAESTLTYDSDSLSIGGNNDQEAAIKRTTHSDDNGGNLGINAGAGTGANKTGGNLKLSAGSSTGAAPGGSIQFFSSAGGSAGSGENTLVEVGSISNIGNLQVDGTLTTGGDITVGGNDIKNASGDTCITFDGSGNTTIAGLLTFPAPTSGADQSTAIVVGPDDDGPNSIKRNPHTDGNGGQFSIMAGSGGSTNSNGGNLDIAAGVGKGSGTPGQIIFRTGTAFGAGVANDSTHGTTTRLTISDKCEFGFGGFSLDGNTITGIDDSSEFTDNDAHIMTSAAINDRFAQINADTTGNAATATALATARNINGVSFDGTGDITVTAAGSTLSDTVTVAKGGTGATSLTSNSILTGNGTSAVQAESTLSYSSSTLNIGTSDSTSAIIQKNAGGSGRLTIQAGNATESGVNIGGDLRLFGGASCGPAAGGSIKFFSTPGGTAGVGVLGTHVEIAGLDSVGNLQLDGGITTGSTLFVNSSGIIQTAAQTNITSVGTLTSLTTSGAIELGHASDTTIARSAAGKVTIEGANVQTSQICCTHHNMSLDGGSSTVDYYFPINSLADGSSSGLYYTRVVAAYDGKIVKILFRGNSLPEGSSSNSFGTNSVIYMSRRDHDGSTYYHQTSGFQASETFNGSSQSTVIVPCGVGGANASDWVFSEGDVLGFSLVKNTTATNIDLAVTIVWEYTV